ncbi:alpha-L-rhamnosidase [Chitinophaga silvisoli]|uniref:alpha-L-rhamnosidase n=1 Tax=Chitinophaga silvisoli TaxID=2291814 RepID=A0A3E1P7T9_9BACT|nr:alpha-L-rhamnosidase [Chitinophaga silvisoli]RFM36243.1 alpha-L-rhamnosidase [Chitinophaga silvisoli]
MINKLVFCLLLLTATTVSGQSVFQSAKWIVPGFKEDTLLRPCPVYLKDIEVHQGLRAATLYLTAHGLYEARINSKRVGDAYFTPGYTRYDKRLQFQQYDVKKLLKKGPNAIAVTVGEGWYRGRFGGALEPDTYGNDAGLLFQLELTYNDGRKVIIVSDSSWLCTTGPIRYSGLYEGELYDTRLKPVLSGPVKTVDFPKDILIASTAPPVREKEQFHPLKVLTTPKGEQVIDFGQNLAGWVRCTLKGSAGDTIRLHHAEILDKEGNFYTGNLREAAATDTYVLDGKGKASFQPHFTWHGFRYVKVEGCRVKPEDFTAIALYSDLTPTGSFSSSNAMLNQLCHNITWSFKGNALDIPTDCPQRSERLGWTGDAQVFCRTASYLFDVDAFFAKWLQDLAAEQAPNGAIPSVIPDVYKKYRKDPRGGTAGWADAATIIPWTLYWVYGDTAVLNRQYMSMKAWVDYINSVSKDGLWQANGYGDWLAPGDSTSLPYIDQCYWANSTQLLINTARVLGKSDDVDKYTRSLQEIKSAFLKNYISPEGEAITNTQTAYVLALQFDMLPVNMKKNAAERLATLVMNKGNHLATGFLGTPYLLHALSENGYTDLAYRVLNQETCPSWLYPVKMGATTIWEKWDAIRPDSSVQAISYNHYSYGAVGEWLYRVVAGIDAASPGYEKILIHPHPGGGLTWVNASYNCAYGKIVSNWKTDNGKFTMHVEIPAGTRATIMIPGKESVEVAAGMYDF